MAGSGMTDLLQLVERDLPEGRRHLRDSHANLEKVAAYCEGNYLQAPDKRHALEETKNYTTQSLASVAYQINTLATNFLHLLDLHTSRLSQMESSINHLSQTVMIHKEKVARREIGILTTNKTTSKPQGLKPPGIIFPEQQERLIKYVRKPIDYNVYDEIGHGVKANHIVGNRPGRSNSTASNKSLIISSAPTTKPPTPPSVARSSGSSTLSKQSSISSAYRSLAPPYAPTVPSHYAPGYQKVGADRRSNHSTGGLQIAEVAPQISQMGQRVSHHQLAQNNSMGEPPPPPPTMPNYTQSGNSSPPLPPPPHQEALTGHYPHEVTYDVSHYHGAHNAPIQVTNGNWAPKSYIEKVVAIYDYHKDKEDELSFTEGAMIYVIRKNDDGWWEGVMNGITGLFPGNYVESCM